jgi:hypothetical protein
MPNGFGGSISDRELEMARRQSAEGGPRTNGRLKRMLGMTQRPTTAGQEIFGDVDASGLRGALSDREVEVARRAAGPTTAGQVQFGDVDVNGSAGALSDRELEMARRAAGY